MKLFVPFVVAVLIATMPLAAETPATVNPPVPDAEDDKPVDPRLIASAVAPYFGRVEYTVKYDEKSNPPKSNGLGDSNSLSNYVLEERTIDRFCVFIAEDVVIAHDIIIHPRFIEKIEVFFNGARASATIAGVYLNHNAVQLKLSEKLPGVSPLVFDPALEAPYYSASYDESDGEWEIDIRGIQLDNYFLVDNGMKYISMRSNCLIVNRDGKPFALSMRSFSWVPADGDMLNEVKTTPDQWELVSVERYQALIDDVKALSDRSLVRAHIEFRSPKKQASRDSQSGSDVTELDVPAIVIGNDKLLVLSGLERKTTARLERIVAHTETGKQMTATFVKSFKNYNCFLAALNDPNGVEGIQLSDKTLFSQLTKLLPCVELNIKGEQIESYRNRRRFASINIGWKKQLYPSFPGDEDNLFVFDSGMKLMAFPMSRRPKPGEDSNWRSRSERSTWSKYIRDIIENPKDEDFDPENVPLVEKEENRLAWIGIELQTLNSELARFNNVSDQTKNGSTGALVSYVYPGSPASKAGIQTGDIVLRIQLEGLPQPVDIKVSQLDELVFTLPPWENHEQIFDENWDRYPTPWTTRETALTKLLTDHGFGKTFRLETIRAGSPVPYEFVIVEGPKTYKSADKYESEELGFIVKNITYEVRRYYQLTDDDIGVLTSEVKQGGKAHVAGLRRYVIITHIDNRPMRSIVDVEEAVARGGELSVRFKRITDGKVINIKR